MFLRSSSASRVGGDPPKISFLAFGAKMGSSVGVKSHQKNLDMFTMITKHHNYDTGYISLVNLELGDLPKTIKFKGNNLLLKNEFHISIMAIKNLAPMLNSNNLELASEQLKQDFINFAASHDLINFRPTGHFRIVTRDDRISIIAMVQLRNIDKLYSYLRAKYDVDFPTQPTHITMYTLQPEAGIGILSEEELERDSINADIPELNGLRIVSS